MTQLPEWVKDDALFKLAEAEGSITYVERQSVTPAGDVPDSGGDGVGGGEPKADDPPQNDGGDAGEPNPDEEPPKTGRGGKRG